MSKKGLLFKNLKVCPIIAGECFVFQGVIALEQFLQQAYWHQNPRRFLFYSSCYSQSVPTANIFSQTIMYDILDISEITKMSHFFISMTRMSLSQPKLTIV